MRLLLRAFLVFHKVCSHTEIKPKKMAFTKKLAYLLHMEPPTQQVIDSKTLYIYEEEAQNTDSHNTVNQSNQLSLPL